MPHYKDGSEVRLGDTAKGTPYNTPHEVCGVVTGITPDSDTCNLRIAFLGQYEPGDTPPTAIIDTQGIPPLLVSVKVDYAETGEFELVYRKEAAPAKQ